MRFVDSFIASDLHVLAKRALAIFISAALSLLWVPAVAAQQTTTAADPLNYGLGGFLIPPSLNDVPATPGTAPQTSTSRTSDDLRPTQTMNRSTATVLSANQIITLLRRQPEVIVDVKQVMSDYFLQRGISVVADSITDDYLFSNLALSADFRQAVSVWLRARGYATDDDFAQSPELATSEDSLDPTRRDVMPSRSDAKTQDDLLKGQDDVNEGAARDAQGQLALALKNLPPGAEVLPKDTLQEPSELYSNNRALNAQQRQQQRPQDIGKTMQPPPGPSERSTREPGVIDTVQQPAPYNLQSLRDLYTQVPEQSVKVKRFGSEVFLSRGLAGKEMPIDLPVGPDYILGAGDSITISMWGGVTQSFTRVVDREGKVVLPEAGPIVVSGLTLERTQGLIQGMLSRQFHDAKVAVSIAKLRTVRVYVVGDVQRPGAYDISSLSTPLNALYAAGGPTSVGSLRVARHMRGTTLVREVDMYDFLRSGVRSDVERLEPGDTVLIPAAGAQVEVSGMVKRPAIYELKGKESLSALLEGAGGLRPTASLTHMRIERIGPDGHRTTMSVDLPEGSTAESARAKMDAFEIHDGDRILVAPILPYSEKSVYVAGHVARPGKVPYRDDMKLTDVLRSYQDMLPEPSEHGEIIRLVSPDMRPEAIEFNVPDALAGNLLLHLQPFDTIRIRGRYESDAPRVTIRGEVVHPGMYALVQGMTAAQLVRIAGGFKRSALLDAADLASYDLRDGHSVESKRETVAIGRAMNSDVAADVPLKPGDVLSVHQISGWNDIGASITLTGEVVYPGTYGLEDGERLSSVLRRAGGLRASAYPDGAVLVRKQVKELEEKSRLEMIRQIETSSVAAKLGTSSSGGEDAATLQLLIAQQQQVLQRLRTQPAVGRLVINVGASISSWEGTSADIELRSGDVLTVPKRPGFVLISGQIYNPSAITFAPGRDAGWYLANAGGETDLANRKEVFVIRANGLVVGRRSGKKVLSTKLNPGDVIVVPQKIIGGSVFWKNTLAAAQVFSSIAFTAALALR